MEKITLILVDDHDVVRTGLKTYLQTQADLEVVAESNSGEKAIELVREYTPDLVLMDITMPGIGGFEATRRIKHEYHDCKVLALTVHLDKQYFFEMLEAGADGYVTKQIAAEELVDAIRAVAAGRVYLQTELATWLLEDYRRLVANQPEKSAKTGKDVEGSAVERLSKREIQVLQYVADGNSNIEIGEKLGISHKTVARHRERIMSKLDIHSCVELVKYAIRTGIIDLE